MMMNHPDEFIGCEIRVMQSKNKDLEGVKGKIIDETRNTFKVLTYHNQEKILLKQGCVFLINNQEINGDKIIQRPEERIKELKK